MINVTKNNKVHAVVIIDQFLDRITLSNKRRSVYYNIKNNLPATVQRKIDNHQFTVVNGGFIVDTSSGEKVLKNVRSAGKPKFMKIAGQDLWVGMDHHLRSKLSREMKIWFWHQLKGITPIMDINQYPIGIGIEIMDVDDNGDIDNMEHIYRKTLHDCLCGNIEFVKNNEDKFVPDRRKYHPIILDDSKQYIQEMWTKFIPIKDHDKRKMTIIIYSI